MYVMWSEYSTDVGEWGQALTMCINYTLGGTEKQGLRQAS